ncbi:hypothetical protein ACFLUY_00350 [Chloroflexota bacterium]
MGEEINLTEREIGLYKREVNRQCTFALIAVSNMNDSLKILNERKDMKDFSNIMDTVWYSIHSLLTATGNLSKVLWPPNQKYRQRGQILKEMFSVEDTSPLNSRTLRNHFEHFDERLDRWISSGGKIFADSNIGPINSMIGNLKPEDYLRHYDPITQTVYFKGDIFEIIPIIQEIKVLHKKSMM